MLASTPFLLPSVAKAAAAAVVNNTALDGSGVNSFSFGATTVLPGLTTSAAGIVCVFVETNGSSTSFAVTSPHLTFTQRVLETAGPNPLMLWAAPSSGALASEVITLTPNAAQFVEGTAFAIKGVNTASNNGFDSNGLLPDSGATGTRSITTSNAADMLIFGSRNGGDVGPPTGWANVLGVSTFGSFLTASCLPVTATQSALSVVDISGSSNGSIAHALVST